LSTLVQRCIAEGIGTFAIVFFGCGAIIVLDPANNPGSHLAVNAVFGLTVATMIYSLGHICKAHFNPAVTIALATGKLFSWREVPAYLVAQILGAAIASLTHASLLPQQAFATGFGYTEPKIGTFPTMILEALLTFFLMFVIVATATDKRASPGFPGLAIGSTVTLCGLFAGPLTGNSLNPARSLAPAIFAGKIPTLLPYFIGPIVGAIVAVIVYQFLREQKTT